MLTDEYKARIKEMLPRDARKLLLKALARIIHRGEAELSDAAHRGTVSGGVEDAVDRV
jgi:Ran GTPase-activating protein (RanGAP) involved in mRNA processing and transport